MTVELEKLKGELMDLPLESRAWLAQTLLHSLDHSADADASAEWLEEIRRRDAEISDGIAICKPLSQTLQETRDRLACSK